MLEKINIIMPGKVCCGGQGEAGGWRALWGGGVAGWVGGQDGMRAGRVGRGGANIHMA